jgi:hypothetical protein
MRMNPELEALGTELTRLGNTVVPHGDHLCVRLPFFASLRVRLKDGMLRFDHRFGMASREWSVIGVTGMLAVLSGIALLLSGTGRLAFGLAFLCMLSAAFDVLRTFVTEAAATRVLMSWAGRRASFQGQSTDQRRLGEAAAPLIEPGASSTPPDMLRTPR